MLVLWRHQLAAPRKASGPLLANLKTKRKGSIYVFVCVRLSLRARATWVYVHTNHLFNSA